MFGLGENSRFDMLRRPLRWLVRLAILLSLLSLFVFISDLKYDFLPAAIQRNLILHPDDPIITDVEIRECSWFNKCERYSSNGKIRVEKDLALESSWLGMPWFRSSSYVYISRINETEIEPNQNVVLNMAIGDFDVSDPKSQLPPAIIEDMRPIVSSDLELADPEHALNVSKKAGWKLENSALKFWVKRGKHIPNSAISAVNIFYGDQVELPVDNWYLTDIVPLSAYKNRPRKLAEFGPRIAFKIGRTIRDKPLETSTPLKFRKDGQLRILQLADLHMSTGYGICDKPALVPDTCIADERTTELVNMVLDTENPDYVIFSGDQIFGSSSPDPETSLLKAVSPVLRRKLPFSMVWGNHDDDGPYDRHRLMNFALSLPGAHMTSPGEEDREMSNVSGVGNYIVEVEPYSSSYPALVLYFLDSHSKMLQAKQKGYDYIKPDQHEWMRSMYTQEMQKLKGYSKVPLSMAFFHIPLPEYRNVDASRMAGGSHKEGVMAPIHNSGTLDVLRELKVSVASVGHDHANDYCLFTDDSESGDIDRRVWLCYGGGTGFGGYGGYPDEEGFYKRRVRIYDVNMEVPSIKTWHRIEGDEERENILTLVNNGIPVFP